MKSSQLIVEIVVLLSLNIAWIRCETQREMTLVVGPGQVECLHENIGSTENIDFEYQVIDGGQGELDINFDLSLGDRTFFSDIKSGDNFHRIEREDHQGGEFKFCFDNTISHFNSKTVFFELVAEDPDRQSDEGEIEGTFFYFWIVTRQMLTLQFSLYTHTQTIMSLTTKTVFHLTSSIRWKLRTSMRLSVRCASTWRKHVRSR